MTIETRQKAYTNNLLDLLNKLSVESDILNLYKKRNNMIGIIKKEYTKRFSYRNVD